MAGNGPSIRHPSKLIPWKKTKSPLPLREPGLPLQPDHDGTPEHPPVCGPRLQEGSDRASNRLEGSGTQTLFPAEWKRDIEQVKGKHTQ